MLLNHPERNVSQTCPECDWTRRNTANVAIRPCKRSIQTQQESLAASSGTCCFTEMPFELLGNVYFDAISWHPFWLDFQVWFVITNIRTTGSYTQSSEARATGYLTASQTSHHRRMPLFPSSLLLPVTLHLQQGDTFRLRRKRRNGPGLEANAAIISYYVIFYVLLWMSNLMNFFLLMQ